MNKDDILVEIQLLPDCEDLVPAYASAGAAGMDLRSRIDFTLAPGERKLIGTGFRLAIPAGWEMQIRPRSGSAYKFGITLANAVGTVDSDYRSEIGVILLNLGSEPFSAKRGDRIAQAVFARAPQVRLSVVASLDATVRGEGGFGSTGHA